MMRRSFLPFACALALFGLASAAFSDDAPASKDPWVSFGVGSFVTMKSTSKTAMAIPDAPVMPEQVTEMRTTLVAVTEKEYTLKSELKPAGGEWSGQEMKIPRTTAAKPAMPDGAKSEDLGAETLTIDGTPIPCKKTKVTVDSTVTIAWSSDKYGAVKSETKGADSESTMTLTKLAKKVTIAGKEIECRESTSSMKGPGVESTAVTLMSDQVPGGMVRSESTSKMTQAQMTSTNVMEVTAFETK